MSCLMKKSLKLRISISNKYGDITILICRFVPVIRHLISIPAGTGRMNIIKFIIYTVIGAGIWNGFLAYAGMVLKSNWEMVMKYSKIIDIAGIGISGAACLFVCLPAP